MGCAAPTFGAIAIGRVAAAIWPAVVLQRVW
jgi:hypothetical protein